MRTLDRVQYKKGTKTYNGVVSEQDVELKVENNSISYTNDGVNYNKSLPILQGDTAPTTSTVGQIGQFYFDKTNVNVYQCNGTVQTPPSPPEYQWELMGGRAKQDVLSSAIVADGTIDKSLGFNSLGMLVKGSASGGSLYRHNITIKSSDKQYCVINATIINNSSTTFNSTSLATFLKDNGFTDYTGTAGYTAAGFFRNSSATSTSVNQVYGLTSNDNGNQVRALYRTTTFEIDNGALIVSYDTASSPITSFSPSVSIYDTVTQIM